MRRERGRGWRSVGRERVEKCEEREERERVEKCGW